MGLIRAALSAATGNLGDQWKEFFYCEAMDKEVLLTKGVKQTRLSSSNKFASDNLITNGSGIAVADGQCMIIVDNGKIVELCAEPGQYTFDQSSEGTIFQGDLKESIMQSLDNMLKRLSYGGDTAHDQRVYYFNTKEIMDNKFGTPNPVPFKIVDSSINLDMDMAVRCAGVYSFKIVDPIMFYMNVCGNVPREFRRDEIETQMKAEFISALQPAFGELSKLNLRPSDIVSHVNELTEAMNKALGDKWLNERGIQICSIAISTLTIPEEDQQTLKNLQKAKVLSDPAMGAATLAAAQADAMRDAAKNEAGAAVGFMGMGMAMNAGGVNAQQLYQMGQNQAAPQAPAPEAAYMPGQINFCPNC
ncbi:MAG: SPFH domain-containing protein [Firmicutes bacterium]|nr:SPFH domain-containing protein [Bacillota bacterium]